MEVTLSTGAVVSFKPFISHKADKVLQNEFNRDVTLIRDAEGIVTGREVPVGNIARGYEAILPLIVASPVITVEWLDELSKEDYAKLSQAAQSLYLGERDREEAGKKNG